MPDPAQLRDAARIVLERGVLAGLDADVTDRFTVTVAPVDDDHCKVVGSPAVINDVTGFLARNGVTVA